MKTVAVDHATVEACITEAQSERVVLTRNGHPVAILVGIEGMDEEQVQLSASDKFWKLITERRKQKTMSRAALEEKLVADKRHTRPPRKRRRPRKETGE